MSVAEPRNHHWKMVMNHKNENGSSLSISGNKRRFTPLKDNSMRDSKIFQKSRQRSNSFAVLNRSKDIQTVSVRDKKMISKLTQGKNHHGQHSVPMSAIKPSDFKSIESVQQAKIHFSALTEIQKQFKLFKQKVLKLLQRQQQQIHQLAKQILSACTLQISKFQQNNTKKQCLNCKSFQESLKLNSNQIVQSFKEINTQEYAINNNPMQKPLKVKQIEDINQQLYDKINKNQLPSRKYVKPQQFQPSKQIPKINFQQIYSKFENVFDIFKKLNQDKLQLQQVTASLSAQQNFSQSPRKNKVFSRKPNVHK